MSEIAARYALTQATSSHTPRPTRFILRGCAGLAIHPDHTEPVAIDVTDVSITGIGFRSDRDIGAGSRLHVAFLDDSRERHWNVEVIWSEEAEAGDWRIGSRLIQS